MKEQVKNLFLDAIGEPRNSPRRTALSGLQASITLSGRGGAKDGGGGGWGGGRLWGATGSPPPLQQRRTTDDIQVILLDERWSRDTLPCDVRGDWWVVGSLWERLAVLAVSGMWAD